MGAVTTAASATAGVVTKTAISVHEVLVDLTKLESPTVAAAVAAFVLKFIPGTGISNGTLVTIVAAVGVVAATIDKFTSKSSSPTSTTPSA